MTPERAIEILDPEHREHYESIEPVNEACRMGMDAIRQVETIRKETAQEIFSWFWRNLVNLNFITGNIEVNFGALQNFAKTYGVEKFGFPEQTENKNE